ncbi:hypothetical protein HQ529_02355 [Candidatus Woesearchaeota archaeon]|nr:hypothetical protein [Candidatus Woesearchaeota archaeon]
MTSIAGRVKEYLDTNFIITSCLLMNIISLRALSRHLCKVLDLTEKNLNAVMSAIRRYKQENKIKETHKTKNVFSDISIKTKDNIVDIYLPKNKSVQENIIKFNSVIDFEKGDLLRIIQAEQGIKVIIDEKNLNKFSEIFSKKDFLSIDKNLAEINIQFSPESIYIKGIVSVISSSLNAGNVNILEIMSSAPELIILVANNDLIKSLNTLNNLKEIY